MHVVQRELPFKGEGFVPTFKRGLKGSTLQGQASREELQGGLQRGLEGGGRVEGGLQGSSKAAFWQPDAGLPLVRKLVSTTPFREFCKPDAMAGERRTEGASGGAS